MTFVVEVTEISVAIIIVSSVIVYYGYYKHLNRALKKIHWIPIVPGWPILGNTLDFLGGTTVILNVFMRYTNLYGKLAIFVLLGKPILLLSDYKYLEHILSSTKIMTKAYTYLLYEEWLGTGLLTSKGNKWKKRRKIITPAFHFSILENFVEIFESNANILVQKLEKEDGKCGFDVEPYIALCTLDSVCETAMGTPIYAQNNGNEEYAKAVKRMCALLLERIFEPIKILRLTYMLTPTYYEERRLLKVLHSHTTSVIELRRNKLENNASCNENVDPDLSIKKKKVFLDILLESTIDGKPLTNEDIREEVDTFMFEGHDTTASALSFSLWCLSNHPDVQKEILNEQMEIFKNSADGELTVRHLQEMKYLESVIKETLRLYPSVPFFGRNVDEDLQFEDGKVLPKGLTILIFPYAIQRDPKYFPNPEEFNPGRFMDISGKNPYAFLPFSAGPRNCIGQKFGMMLMKIIISKILRNYEILPTRPRHEVILSEETVLKSTTGMKMRIKKRDKDLASFVNL